MADVRAESNYVFCCRCFSTRRDAAQRNKNKNELLNLFQAVVSVFRLTSIVVRLSENVLLSAGTETGIHIAFLPVKRIQRDKWEVPELGWILRAHCDTRDPY